MFTNSTQPPPQQKRGQVPEFLDTLPLICVLPISYIITLDLLYLLPTSDYVDSWYFFSAKTWSAPFSDHTTKCKHTTIQDNSLPFPIYLTKTGSSWYHVQLTAPAPLLIIHCNKQNWCHPHLLHPTSKTTNAMHPLHQARYILSSIAPNKISSPCSSSILLTDLILPPPPLHHTKLAHPAHPPSNWTNYNLPLCLLYQVRPNHYPSNEPITSTVTNLIAHSQEFMDIVPVYQQSLIHHWVTTHTLTPGSEPPIYPSPLIDPVLNCPSNSPRYSPDFAWRFSYRATEFPSPSQVKSILPQLFDGNRKDEDNNNYSRTVLVYVVDNTYKLILHL